MRRYYGDIQDKRIASSYNDSAFLICNTTEAEALADKILADKGVLDREALPNLVEIAFRLLALSATTTSTSEDDDTPRVRRRTRTKVRAVPSCFGPLPSHIYMYIKIKIHSSCEIEYLVETHLCKLCVILRLRVL